MSTLIELIQKYSTILDGKSAWVSMDFKDKQGVKHTKHYLKVDSGADKPTFVEYNKTELVRNGITYILEVNLAGSTYKDYLTGDGEYENKTDEQISSGVLWGYSGQKGLSIGLRYIDSKTFLNTTNVPNYLQKNIQVSTGKGYRLSVDFEF